MPLRNPTPYTAGKTIVYFIRHGDRAEEIKDAPRIPGPSLSTLGIQQAQECARVLQHLRGEVDVLYTSTMARAHQTMHPFEKLTRKKAKRLPFLVEIPRSLSRPVWHPAHWRARWYRRNAIRTFQDILTKHQGKVILIVAHGRLIKHLIGNALGISIAQADRFDYHNCHISKARFKGTRLDYIHYFNSSGVPGKGLSIPHRRTGSSA